ncbi:hypothetical protein [Nannocystis punicea]|uniref:Uncharacterized protein n=1 Tax=Nannocystis punicea TaxID=2995304 RepID=A0ABY7H7T2_9BACT|nr:hypothetical protein [Nannocystis poenicansa]WAS95317.1 hypothetical protein O0S08_04085 [Nannocystis poenicansa]
MALTARLSLAFVILSAACAGRSHESPTTEAALRAGLDRHTCARWEPEVRQWSLLLFDATCDPASASGGAAALVRAVVARLRPLSLLAGAAYDRFYERAGGSPPPRPAEAQRLADAAVWSDSLLSGAIWQAVAVELADRGLACRDCPPRREPPQATIPWAEFSPYLAAHVWPVQSSADAPVEIFTCTGINGAAALPADPTLLRAGQLVAFAFADDEAVGRRLHALAGQGSLAEVSRGVRSYLDSPSGREFACAALTRVAWFTGLHISDC